MEEDEEEQRRRKVEVGRAKLAHFRQRKTKGDCAHSKKTPAKRKGAAVHAPVQKESAVASAEDGGLLGGPDVGRNTSCSSPPDGAGAAQLQQPGGEGTPQKLDGDCLEQPGVMTKELELEALRLSLSDMHAARLELTQAHLQREKEAALAELRAELTGRHAQERALLQSRAHRELELVREEAAELKEKLQSEVEKNAQMIETLKQDWESERDLCLENVRQELLEKHRSELENLQNQFKRELAEQKAELEKVFQAKNQAEFSLQTQEAQREAALSRLRADLQLEHCQHVDALELNFREKEEDSQRQLENLRASYAELQAQSREEIQRLGAQLDSARSSRRELSGEEPRVQNSELHGQLLARASHVEELEQLQRDLEQQRQQDRTRHEREPEQLRLCFEEKLREAERGYQEDLRLLQQRLRDGRDEPLPEAVGSSSPSACLEELSEEGRGCLDPLGLRLEQHEESLGLHTRVEENHQHQLAAGTSSQEVQQEAGLPGTRVLEGEQHVGPLEESGQELARTPLLCAQSRASEAETEVVAGDGGLATTHKAQLLRLPMELKEEIDLLKVENRNLHEKLQHEIRLKEDLEKVKCALVEAHQEELKSTKEKIELMEQEVREREAEWKVSSEDLRRGAEERLARTLRDLREQAESEKRSMMHRFELRETEMRRLQEQQAAQILDLEGSLVEQQGRLRQLELGLVGDACLRCSQCGWELGSSLAPADQDHLKEDCALQLKLAQSRFLEERREITEKFAAEQDAFLREAREKHARELQLLQETHQQHVLSLTAELEARHQAEVGALRASLEREQWALSEVRVAELQTKHAAEISALETRHASHLDALESCYLSEVQTVRAEHRRALELLCLDLEEQLQEGDASRHVVLTRVLEKLKLGRGEEPPPAQDSLRVDVGTEHVAGLRAPRLHGACQQGTLVPAELEPQRSALLAELEEEQEEGEKQRPRCQEETELLKRQPEASLEQQVTQLKGEFESEKKAALHEKEEMYKLEREQAQSLHQKEKESLSLQLQEKNNQILQLKDQILSLSGEIDECRSELERLQQRRDRENQESTALVSMLRSDVDLSRGERRALRDSLRRLLGLFGETVKAAVALKSRIGERVGLCLEDESPPAAQPGRQSPPAALALDEVWPGLDAALPELDGTSPAGAETSSVAEISSHVCESFFMSPETTLECEQPVRRVYRSLGLAVDGLLEMVLDSARQLEEARQIHSRLEEEFSCKKEETAQVVRMQRELVERLEAEGAARAQLALELHKAEGIVEGFKEEKASLQEALGQKEASERDLVGELEGLRQQLQRAARRQEALQEENAALWSQREALAAEAGEREAALRKEVESLTKEQSETRKQSEKDRSALLSQMRLLEAELEEQLSRQQACARQAEELSALRQQMGSLDQHLRRQRQFMDAQAVEREREREDFQQEIQRLEEQLRQAARPRPPGPRASDIELLEDKLREKSDGLNELIIKKELADRQVFIQEEEIKRLQETNASTTRTLVQLQEELERQRKAARDLERDKEALQEQQMSNLLLVSTLQSRLDEGRCPVPPVDSPPDGQEVQLEAVQRALLQREDEVLDLKEQLEKIKDDLVSKNEEVLNLNLKLDMQDNSASIRIRELQEENADLKAFLQNQEREMMCQSEQAGVQLAGPGGGAVSEVVYNRSSEIEELKSIIENLRENQERLQRDKAEEIEQLHEVIEKLQRELLLGGPMAPEAGDGGAASLQSELLGLPAEGAEARVALEGELHAALEAKEALSRLLTEQERRHGQALEALQRRLQAAEQAATRQLAEPGPGAALREAEVQDLASQVREFEAALRAKEAKIAERDLEIDTLHRQTSAHSAELGAILAAVARFRRALEQQLLVAAGEPPELQRLRAQCVRLSRQLQALNQSFLRCQKELDEQQARGACVESGSRGRMSWGEEASCHKELEQDVGGRRLAKAPHGHGSDPQSPVKDGPPPAKARPTLTRAGLSHQDRVMSLLAVCQRQLESELLLVRKEMHLRVEDGGRVPETVKDKEKVLGDCQLRNVDLIAQVKQLQEKLNHLVCSMSFQNVKMNFKFQQTLASPHASESSLSDSSSSGEETDTSPPVHASPAAWALAGTAGSQGSLIRGEEAPDAPTGEQVALQDSSLCSQGSLQGGSCHLAQEPEPLKNTLRAMDLSSWSSPEVVRKDSTPEPLPSLPLTPRSDALSQRSLDSSLWDRTSAQLLRADQSGLLCYPGASAADTAPGWAGSPLAADGAPSPDHHAQHVPVEKDVEDFIVTSLDSQEKSRSPPLGLEGKSDGKSDGAGSGEIVNQDSGRRGAPIAGPAAPPTPRGSPRPPDTMKEKDVHPKQVKALLQMVCDESHHILALSEYHGPPCILSRGEPSAPLECLAMGGQSLLEAAPAPREHPTPGLHTGEKEASDMGLDWRGEFLQVVQEALEKERAMLRVELQPRLCGSGPGGCGPLLQRLEQVVQEQGDLQERSLEHLRLSDRNSLLSEIQALRAQLRMTHLQNQEKLQQLCEALTSAEARGSRQEHQLRRQVELLAYKVEQEKCIASDLQKTLNEEQEKANSVRKLLVVEQNAVRDLKSELCECRQDNERLLQSLNAVQKEVLQLRSVLDSKEDDLQAALQRLEGEQVKECALQSRLEEERLQHLQREGQSAKTLEELRASLEKQCAQSNQLCVALKHEQMAKDNLRKELQIEASRCEALLAQERGHLSELQRSLEAEQGRSRELSEALQHERLLTERLSRRSQDRLAHQALLQKLQGREARVLELEAALEAAQQRVLEAKARARREEVEREQERELELQRQRDKHRIQQLQRTVRELRAREAARPCPEPEPEPEPEPGRLREQQRRLERARQQLLCAAGLLSSVLNQTVDRTISDWTSSNEKAVASLLHTLETLKSELGASSSCQKKTTAELQVQLVDVLLKDNESLSRALSTVTREKAELCRAVSWLERAPRAPRTPQEGCARRRSDRSARKPDRAVSPGSARHPDPALPTLEAGACNAKMEKLYLHYLRAESFRKALIYQKKYLLLLIGGFQDSEQETLSMIAHLGVFPSKADKKAAASRPFTKFRTAVRAVIAIFRLRFLVKKWQQVDGRGALAPGCARRPGARPGPGPGPAPAPVPPHPGFLVPRRQQSPPDTRKSPPTRDVSSSHASDPVPKMSPRRRDRSERSLTASQDPERSLTEYIHHLEVIQQRLGGAPPGSPSEESRCQKTKQ
ncbi:pericentrin isoform X4 [Hippopotamus amphibius kiboko]|uniref:pericentrin isoform X4 n=1 Tax=Hippopotamus amphibius kiboko TaxID=575201 RepID=UPI0025973BD5|nr:pericentrin isoform X4 [Hippopotamus amphibius kiboko]